MLKIAERLGVDYEALSDEDEYEIWELDVAEMEPAEPAKTWWKFW